TVLHNAANSNTLVTHPRTAPQAAQGRLAAFAPQPSGSTLEAIEAKTETKSMASVSTVSTGSKVNGC
ncbi:hypothetical protein, partial [Shimia sp. R9_3]|uniref:hypothetical protein n=1 Tax=Shimia sp. R9_3 TaxID=2821113 RepID=UPI001ADCC0C1